MRISDWSSDVCSSDLFNGLCLQKPARKSERRHPCSQRESPDGGCILFDRHEPIAGMSGNAAALAMSQAIPRQRGSADAESWRAEWRDRLSELDLVPDLGDDIGSRIWWRGLATLTLLCGRAIATFPRSEEHTSELQSLMRISYAV